MKFKNLLVTIRRKIRLHISSYFCINQKKSLEIEIKSLAILISGTKRILKLYLKSLKSRKVWLVLIGKGCSIIKSVFSH
jgi:hypothetical protein